ncbi:hypothetical protein NE237_002028 [Protea cynaroides]|uniref:Uncharacterized protein n=1 Tax=Protea cynaroides TaxID=273540 RepID=A0A9Q0KUH0_9MAGN|nr:hypothetical protein NE237_002028 [Protea cynaroides]
MVQEPVEDEEREGTEGSNSRYHKDKSWWSFGKSGSYSSGSGQFLASIPTNIPATETAWLRSYYTETEKEQSNRQLKQKSTSVNFCLLEKLVKQKSSSPSGFSGTPETLYVSVFINM